nr:hypothetical protein [Epilithonimonas hominis]
MQLHILKTEKRLKLKLKINLIKMFYIEIALNGKAVKDFTIKHQDIMKGEK